jgi:FkbM family methyltransferase
MNLIKNNSMKYRIAALLKQILPDSVVYRIKMYRRRKRIEKYYAINNGDDIVKTVKTESESFDMYLNPYLNAGVDYEIFKNGVWEVEISQLIKKYLPVGGVFVDIGANIGYHSLYAAARVTATGVVYSFEPIPRLAQQIEKSAVANNFNNITIFNTALSDKAGQATLSLIDENIGASSLKNAIDQKLVTEKITVRVSTLDTFLSHFQRLDLIKIDIEGNEFEALRGGVQVLKKYTPVIIMEFSHVMYEHDYIGKTKEFITFLDKLGYSFFTLDEMQIELESVLTGKAEQNDIICRVI